MMTLQQLFDKWFSKNYDRLRTKLTAKGGFDPDTFHDTYLTCRKEVRAHNIYSERFEQLTLNTYKDIRRHHISGSYAVCHPKEVFFTLLADSHSTDDSSTHSDPETTPTKKEVLRFVRNERPSVARLIFECKIIGMSVTGISAATGMTVQSVRAINEATINAIRHKFNHQTAL